MTEHAPETGADADVWSDWLLRRRHGNSAEYARQGRLSIDTYVARVVEGARLVPGMTLVDVGTGEGVVAFKALARIGPSLQAILTDVSGPLLAEAERQAEQRQVRAQCRFMQCAADHLPGIPDASVDAVTARSVLAYVADKRAAFREFLRILKPGGRLSIAEPVFKDESLRLIAMKQWLADHPDHERARTLRLIHQWLSAQYPDTLEAMMANPLTNYSERDLFAMVQEARFEDVHLEFHMDAIAGQAVPWETFVESSPHPLAPTLKEILRDRFDDDDRAFFEQSVQPLVKDEASGGVRRMVYLTAAKPLR